ncbi:unnamed protein product [Notodromas monacha]|uniref:Uncharacterized protein n=1 Tax=Notodromas monacha TaxID=399045 RepID=A0A7R9BDL7_9CRUS|nr:unnamed protein product [Notodromas monacha]CAG0913378.1 unnamed protein product [Notodromas monacha]
MQSAPVIIVSEGFASKTWYGRKKTCNYHRHFYAADEQCSSRLQATEGDSETVGGKTCTLRLKKKSSSNNHVIEQYGDGIPIHIKGGTKDKFLYLSTLGLTGIGLVMVGQIFYNLVFPSKRA